MGCYRRFFPVPFFYSEIPNFHYESTSFSFDQFTFLFCEDSHKEAEIWKIDSTNDRRQSYHLLENPRVISGEGGDVVEFGGKKDGFLVNENPVLGRDIHY